MASIKYYVVEDYSHCISKFRIMLIDFHSILGNSFTNETTSAQTETTDSLAQASIHIMWRNGNAM